MPTSKTLQAGTAYSTRWSSQRINRRLDDKDNLMAQALQLIEEHDTTALPQIQSISIGAALSNGGPAITGCTLTANGNAFGDSTQPSGTSADGTGVLSFVAIVPGDHEITVDIVGDATVTAGAETVVIASTTITVNIEDGVSSAAQIKSALDGDATAPLMIATTVDGAGAMVEEEVSVDGGAGEVMTFSIGARDMLDFTTGDCVTAIDTATGIITFDFDPTSGAVGDVLPIYLRLDGCLCPVVSLSVLA